MLGDCEAELIMNLLFDTFLVTFNYTFLVRVTFKIHLKIEITYFIHDVPSGFETALSNQKSGRAESFG